MIVNLIEEGWEIFYHRAHALLAAQLAAYWYVIENQSHLLETIAAIAHHDDLEREWEEEMITPAGAPLDFQLDQSLAADSWEHHITNALYRSRWVALLTSMHLCFLSQQGDEISKQTQAFLEKQEKQQAQWREELGVSKEKTEQSYHFMRWCDRLSLILCQRKLPAAERWLEIIQDPSGDRYDVQQRSDGTITVKPWPFRLDKFELHADAYYLKQLKFSSSQALKKALKTAPVQLVTWTFAR